MIEKIIGYSIHNKFLVLLFIVVIIFLGIYSMVNISLDAIPDLSDVQVIIQTEYSGQTPQVVEDQVTYPLTTAMLSVPYAKVVRGFSFFGLSFVYVIFEDGTDLYWARSKVLEYLNFVSERLPAGVTPTLGPDATGLGWIFQYTVEDKSGKHDLAQLRSIQDWFLKYELMSVPGVAEVASAGGFVKQYQVEIDPAKILAFNIPLNKIKIAIKKSNNDVGGKLIEMSETEFMVRGKGYMKTLEDIKNISLGVDDNGTPVLLKQIARVRLGPELRRGITERDGIGEVVGGIIVMRSGENALRVIEDVKKKIEGLKPGLPDGVEIIHSYDRSSLINRAIETLKKKLTEEMIVVAIIIIVFLLHFQSSFVAILTLPVGVLISFIIMYLLNINANIMSLGGIAIAIGVMVDASVVMVENAHKHLEREGTKMSHQDLILLASKEVGPALFYSLLIITVSFIPVFALGEESGRLFKPLAYTKTFAMAASAFLAITMIPVLMVFFVRGKILSEQKNTLSRFFIMIYRPIINFVLRRRILVIVLAVILLGITIIPLLKLGSEFMPPLNEGDLLYMPTTLPGLSITKARELLQQTDKIIKSFPEVKQVFGKIGRAETATDPAPLTMIETTILLHDSEKWRDGMTMDKLIEELDNAVQIPGLTNSWTMPIKSRIDMLSTGIKTPVGIKIMGADYNVIVNIGRQIENLVKKLPGTLSAYSERITGGNFLDIEINRQRIARYALTIADVQDVIKYAVGGMNITYTIEGLERYPVNLRYSRELRDNIPTLKKILVPTPTGTQIPLGQLADISINDGPPVIKSENSRKTSWIWIDIKGIDVGSYVENARKVVNENIKLPEGYNIIWSGQFEYMEKASRRLKFIIPVTILIIFILLYFHFKNITESVIVMISLPFALIGGIWFIYFSNYNMSVAVMVGFIALSGLAAETGVVMLVYIDDAFKKRLNQNKMINKTDVYTAITEGAVDRVRPKLMTVTTTMIGLLPILIGTGTGSQVMKRIAAPMVGGLVSSTILTLIIIPVIYSFFLNYKQRKINNNIQEKN